MDKDSKIFIAGQGGLVGSAIVRKLIAEGFTNLLTPTRSTLDLQDKNAVYEYFRLNQPEYVFLAAAKVGGILANSQQPVEFLLENLEIETNVISAAHEFNTQKLLFLGSSCIYPKFAEQPITEDSLLTGALEQTNEMYAIAKIAGIKLCQAYRREYGNDFISVMPTNLYGPNDNFDLETSHVLPALIRKFDDAKKSGSPEVILWGTGSPRREFLFVDDLANSLLFVMKNYSDEAILNIGVGEDVAIKELAEIIKQIVGYDGLIKWDTSKPDGTPQKLLDVSRLQNLGWKAKTTLEEGIRTTYRSYLQDLA